MENINVFWKKQGLKLVKLKYVLFFIYLNNHALQKFPLKLRLNITV